MTQIGFKNILQLQLFILVLACGGGGKIDNENSEESVPSYETLDSAAEKTSQLVATAIVSDDEGNLKLERSNGSIQHSSGKISTGHGGVVDQEDLAKNYQYTMIYNQSYEETGRVSDAFGVGGIVTSVSDMPKRNHEVVTYSGQSLTQLITSNAGYELVGNSALTVNFDTSKIDARMENFVTTDLSNGETVDNPIGGILVDGADISGSGFSGGTFTVLKKGPTVNLAGGNSSSKMIGNFYGYDATKAAPDEIGGVFLQKGDDAILSGIFFAD